MTAAVIDVTSWEQLADAGRRAADDMDRGRFTIGLLALEVEKDYGNDSIGKFAVDIHVEKDRVQDYRGVCAYYEKSIRTGILTECPNLRFSHFKVAKRFGDLASSLAFLREANDNAWSCELTRIKAIERLGQPTPPMKLLDDSGPLSVVLARVASALGGTDKQVRIVIYEVQP